jgi:hypothetical protein
VARHGSLTRGQRGEQGLLRVQLRLDFTLVVANVIEAQMSVTTGRVVCEEHGIRRVRVSSRV